MEKRVEKDEVIPRMRTIFDLKSEKSAESAIEKHNEMVRKGEWIIRFK